MALNLAGTRLDELSQPYVIAEIGVNHEGDLDTALRLIEQAAAGGANAAKFQTYKAETLASRNSPAYWDVSKEPTTSQFELFKKYDSFGHAEYETLARHCHDQGIDFLSTPFDLEAVDMLDRWVPFFKVASADITNVPLLRAVAATGKPVLLSTGASDLQEIDNSVEELRSHGATDVILMHCVLAYPTLNSDAHLRMISGLKRRFPDLVIGYSDHTVPTPDLDSLLVAFMQGALVLEKHFTHDKTLPGNDHYHAMDAADLKCFRAKIRKVLQLLGDEFDKAPVAAELPARKHARRSIVARHDLAAGTVLNEKDLICKRPGSGISPLHWDEVVGRRTLERIEEDALLQWPQLGDG